MNIFNEHSGAKMRTQRSLQVTLINRWQHKQMQFHFSGQRDGYQEYFSYLYYYNRIDHNDRIHLNMYVRK